MTAMPMGSLTGSTQRRFHDFQDLMRHRIMDILLVSTPYDTFLLEEAGELAERILGEFRNLDLHYAPALTGVETGEQALDLLRRQQRFNLIITTPHLADMNAAELARRVRAEGRDVPVVLLAWDKQELKDLAARTDLSGIERSFLWQGDARILVGIVKSVEDRRNVGNDSRAVGVQVILLVEDNVRYYSSFLPVMYAELLQHSQRVITEGLNLSQKILRMRARPKILLCTTYEEAEAAFEAFGDDMLGIISDIEFPLRRGGPKSAEAGAELARRVRGSFPDVPIILHSSRPENEERARALGANFLLKGSPFLLQDLRRVMLHDFGFGDFVFRRPDGSEVARTSDLRGLEEKLRTVPDESILFHAARNHFSRWLKARTEFVLAHELRPRRTTDYASTQALRESLIDSIARYREELGQVLVADFDRTSFDGASDFYRIGGGSLGGKARGLAFVRRLLTLRGLRRQFPGLEIAVPPAVVVGTDVFDRFLDDNDLRHPAIEGDDDEEVLRRFLAAPFPEEAERDLAAFLERATYPLAVRSSSLLEDSQHQPFTGVYDTLMLPNNAWSLAERLAEVVRAVKRVYASCFTRHAKAYLRATSYRLEEEKMAVIVQKIVGAAHGPRFYPDFSGVVRSHNFYPAPPATADDGIAAVALGLGRAIVEGGRCLRFCPRYPLASSAGTIDELLDATQNGFWALPLEGGGGSGNGDMREEWFGLEVAEADGTLAALGSTYSPENDAIYDGLGRPGPRLVTFAPLLKHGRLPLAEALLALMAEAAHGLGTPVEIELAVNLQVPAGHPVELGFLQMRPLALARESEALELGEVAPETILCASPRVLGHGALDGIRDLVVVDFRRFERAKSREAAAEVGRLNGLLLERRIPFLLIGVGRWGSRDPWLGIPVLWDQVCGAQVIVEAGLRDLKVTPSQGSHFFQNLTSFSVGYFTVNPSDGDGTLDWEWLDAQPTESARDHVRHIRCAQPVRIRMDGKRGRGVILKPAP
jgi:CheY-like chemotaxis protein